MKKQSLSAILDANLLYSAAMRDLFMRLAVRFVFQPKWTEAVLENRPDIPRVALERTRDLMNWFGNDWEVPPYQNLTAELTLSDPDEYSVSFSTRSQIISCRAIRKHRASLRNLVTGCIICLILVY